MKRLTTYIILCSALILTAFSSCNKDNAPYAAAPKITRLNQPYNQIRWQDTTDKIYIPFGFEDGGGDLGILPTVMDTSIVVYNVRPNVVDSVATMDTFARYTMPFPQINEAEFKKNGNISGRLDVILNNFYHYPRLDSIHQDGKDTCYWHIYIQDASGNKSNIAIVGPIYMAP